MIASLSDLLHSIHLLRADSAIIEVGADAAVQLQMRNAVLLHLVLAGDVMFRFPARDHCAMLHAGEFLFAPPGTDHIVGAEVATDRIKSQYFDTCQATDAPRVLPIGKGRPRLRVLSCAIYIDQARHETLVRLLPELRRYRARNGPTVFSSGPLLDIGGVSRAVQGAGGTAVALKLAALLLVDATRISLTRDLSPAFASGVPDMAQIGTALRILYQDPARHWSIGMLARDVGMSRSAFAAAFARIVKTTPMRFLTDIRITRAKSLLKDGSHALPQIAHLTGYASETAFARAFKRASGVSPGSYRRALHGTGEDGPTEDRHAEI